jgi:hypothetical protein
VRSGLGLHLVRLESRLPGQVPELSAIRAVVAREWANEKRIETQRVINERLLEQFEITVEWPEPAS